jgi:hypothetical protein
MTRLIRSMPLMLTEIFLLLLACTTLVGLVPANLKMDRALVSGRTKQRSGDRPNIVLFVAYDLTVTDNGCRSP